MDKLWELLRRTKVYSSKFVNVYEDKVRLPNGEIIDDYTLVEKPNIVIIVATDNKNNIVVLEEYKYGANQVLKTLPAGHIKANETAIEAAKRELLEETGFSGNRYVEVGILYDYPSKDIHKVYVVIVENIENIQEPNHDSTEQINFKLIPKMLLKDQIKNREWKISSSLAALTLAGILY